MKITRIDAVPVEISINAVTLTKRRTARTVFVRIQTDSGLVGFGEGAPSSKTFPGETQETALTIIRKNLAPPLRGQDPLAIPHIIEQMDAIVQGNNAAKTAIDLALHDLVGKAEGVSVSTILGGAVRERLPAFELLPVLEPEATADLVSRLKQEGVNDFKVKVGTKRGDDMARLKVTREVAGPHANIKGDANQNWSLQTAIAFLNAAHRDGLIDVIEQPLPTFDFLGLAQLKKSVPVPIMADESVICFEDGSNLLRENVFAFVNLKLSRLGGLYKAKKFASLCNSMGVEAMAGAGFNSKLLDAAGCHLFGTSSAVVFQELKAVRGFWLKESITSGVSVKDGMIEVPKEPGLGMQVDEAIFKQLD
jgi:L-alanine-DL-glutamate epimerase-like enolase superfamily enzyme